MEPHEIIAYSFLSKKALSLVQSLHLPLENARIEICEWPVTYFDFGYISILMEWRMGGNNREITSLDDIPVSVDVTTQRNGDYTNIESETFAWSVQKKSMSEWIQNLCSIFQFDCYEADFTIGNLRVDVQSLRNAFPKIRGISIFGFLEDEPNDQYIQNAQIILRAFMPDVEKLKLLGVAFQENLSLEHIGMANLKNLKLYAARNLKLNDLLILNVERCIIFKHHLDRFSLRDLNRFFKLWMKGSNPRLKYLKIHGENISDWDALMKGLQAEEAIEDNKEYTIQNCYGIRARIKLVNIRFVVVVEFTVSH
ncbi:unnamed protein product [Caenorhabditis nigoni]